MHLRILLMLLMLLCYFRSGSGDTIGIMKSFGVLLSEVQGPAWYYESELAPTAVDVTLNIRSHLTSHAVRDRFDDFMKSKCAGLSSVHRRKRQVADEKSLPKSTLNATIADILTIQRTDSRSRVVTSEEREIADIEQTITYLFDLNRLPPNEKYRKLIVKNIPGAMRDLPTNDVKVYPISCSKDSIALKLIVSIYPGTKRPGKVYEVAHQGDFTNENAVYRFRDVPKLMFDPIEEAPIFPAKCDRKNTGLYCKGVIGKCTPLTVDNCTVLSEFAPSNYTRVINTVDTSFVATNLREFYYANGTTSEIRYVAESGLVRLQSSYGTSFVFGTTVVQGRSLLRLEANTRNVTAKKLPDFMIDDWTAMRTELGADDPQVVALASLFYGSTRFFALYGLCVFFTITAPFLCYIVGSFAYLCCIFWFGETKMEKAGNSRTTPKAASGTASGTPLVKPIAIQTV